MDIERFGFPERDDPRIKPMDQRSQGQKIKTASGRNLQQGHVANSPGFGDGLSATLRTAMRGSF
jgi:hypothetical protein